MAAETHEDDHADDTATDVAEGNDGPEGSLIPDADAGPTDAAKFSRDEKGHGRQDYGP